MTTVDRFPTIAVGARSVPGRCIWCREPIDPLTGSRTDTSHVLNQCLGNADQQILPPGVVCVACNNYFGAKIDPALLAFAPLRMNAALLEVMNPKKHRLFQSSVLGLGPIPDAPSTVINVTLTVSPTKLSLDLHEPNVGRYEDEYELRRLRLLSRAVHKFLVESVAWHIHVRGEGEQLDLLDGAFDSVRNWARYGQPQGQARPWLWAFQSQERLPQSWRVWPVECADGRAFGRADLFGSWFFADLTSDSGTVLQSLSETRPAPNTYRFSDTIQDAFSS